MGLVTGEDLKKSYMSGQIEVKALNGLNFEIESGNLISFIGPSGSGKTTLLNLIGCLDNPSSGRLMVADADISTLSKREAALFRGNNIGFIFQDFNLLAVLTVYENVEYPLLMLGKVPAREREKRVMDLLEAVGMSEQRDKYPDQISGGQQQRVAVARALVTNPRLVLADEPTANLDHKTAYMVINLMKEMKDKSGTTFIFSTHDHKVVDEVEIIYTLQDGKIIDKSDKLKSNHVH